MIDWNQAKERLDRAMANVQELQAIATEHGIDDIFQDNGGKVLQSLIILRLRQIPGREGNDAVNDDGHEFELKTVNVLKQKQVTTHHHLNLTILFKYRAVAGWYISLYEGINLREIYRIETTALEGLFSEWEARIQMGMADGKRPDYALNNPKIPLTAIAEALASGKAARVYKSTSELSDDSLLESVLSGRRRRLRGAVRKTKSEQKKVKESRQHYSLWQDDQG